MISNNNETRRGELTQRFDSNLIAVEFYLIREISQIFLTFLSFFSLRISVKPILEVWLEINFKNLHPHNAHGFLERGLIQWM